MARHVMGPGDLRLVRWAEDVQLSEDGGRVAWCETALDLERDEPVSNIMVTATDGSGRPRRFTDGPHDLSPRWSPDEQYLAYLCASGGSPGSPPRAPRRWHADQGRLAGSRPLDRVVAHR